MKETIKKQFPQWIFNLTQENNICMTADIDSLLSIELLKRYYAKRNITLNIKGYYDFKRLISEKEEVKRTKTVFVDCAMNLDFMCVDNHLSIHKNKNAVNPNIFMKDSNYYSKYGCSTVLLMCALLGLDFDVSLLSDEAKCVILAIDASYKGYYYSSNKKIQESHDYYVNDILGLDWVYPMLKKYDQDYFKLLIKKYNLYKNIKLGQEKGCFTTDIKIEEINELLGVKMELPKFTNYKVANFKKNAVQGCGDCIDKSKIFSSARIDPRTTIVTTFNNNNNTKK